MTEATTAPQRLARVVLATLAPACALGTAASEITVALATLVAGAWWIARKLGIGGPTLAGPGASRAAVRLSPIGGAATWAYALVWLLLVPLSGDLHEGLGHAWPIAPLLVIPVLVVAAGRAPGVRLGLLFAAGLGLWGAVEGIFREAHGPFSHHLTLAYALLPPLGVALQRRSALAIPILLGVLGSRSSGALVAVTVTVVLGLYAGFDAARGRPARPQRSAAAALVGMAITVAGLPFADRVELGERAVLWTGGLYTGLGVPAGPGGYTAASAPIYDQLRAGFWFPNHAHDSATQLLAVLGPAGWLCGLLWVAALFEGFGAGAAAGLAGVCIGSLTQDTFGDLEVLRAVVIWGALG